MLGNVIIILAWISSTLSILRWKRSRTGGGWSPVMFWMVGWVPSQGRDSLRVLGQPSSKPLPALPAASPLGFKPTPSSMSSVPCPACLAPGKAILRIERNLAGRYQLCYLGIVVPTQSFSLCLGLWASLPISSRLLMPWGCHCLLEPLPRWGWLSLLSLS